MPINAKSLHRQRQVAGAAQCDTRTSNAGQLNGSIEYEYNGRQAVCFVFLAAQIWYIQCTIESGGRVCAKGNIKTHAVLMVIR